MHTRYLVNRTDDYHRLELDTLGWELTVCNSLFDAESPCRKILTTNASFGGHLLAYLHAHMDFKSLYNVLEVGGGLGCLMRDLLALHPDLHVTMLDISPYLLEKQKETLAGTDTVFRSLDFLQMERSDLRSFDWVILNENLGDFPTLVPDDGNQTGLAPAPDEMIERLGDYAHRYGLQFAPDENINIGALDVLENLCRADIRYFFISEHSCEASPMGQIAKHLDISPSGNPERISLKGHAEYTLKFSHLAHVAKQNGYRVIRGPFTDFLPLDFGHPKVRTALMSPSAMSDEQEILRQFLYDLHKYEYLLCTKPQAI